MLIIEVTNAKDQLELLRIIINNTWTAIKQEADIQAKQAPPKAKPKAQPTPKVTPIPQPKPNPAARLPQQSAKKPLPAAPKEVPYNIISPINQNRSEAEKKELANQAKGISPYKPLK